LSQGCFKIGVLRTPGWEAAVGDGFAGPPPYTATRHLIGVLSTPGWEAAVGDGFAGPPPYTATRHLGRLAIADSLGLTCRVTPAGL
jgi:hypothetical protein